MEFSCDDFLSHPGISLVKHLELVGRTARHVLEEQGIRDQQILRVAEIIGKTHDFGKYTRYFQGKLRGQTYRPSLTAHAPLSALLGSWLVFRETGDDLLTLAALAAIYHHHGSITIRLLDDLKEWIIEFSKSEDARKQVDSIRRCLPQVEAELQHIGVTLLRDFVDEFSSDSPFRSLRTSIKRLGSLTNGDVRESFERLYKVLLLFSALIYADKSEVGGLGGSHRLRISRDLFDRHRPYTTCSEQLRWVREEVYSRAVGKVEELLRTGTLPRVLRITAPTGAGKTATAMSIALRIRDYVERVYGIKPRIIYCLPYINIIEQAHDTIWNVLLADGIDPSPTILLKHHHLYPARMVRRDGEEEPEKQREVEVEKQLLAFDSWDSEIVVTTFVQIFETLLGVKNRMLLKFHKLFGSVIILDEVQTLPMELWALIRRALEGLSKYSWLLLMSATSPSMLSPADASDLIKGHEELYERLNRVNYHYIDREMSIEDAALFVRDVLRGNGARSLAVVVNTVAASIDLYNRIKELVGGVVPISDKASLNSPASPIIAYLSTNIVPRDRMRRINLLKELLNSGRQVIVVCTQVIEAGVDLDFDAIVRDLAPLDSIVQAGGRCNRNDLKAGGNVYIIRLVREGNPTYPKVYGKLAVENATLPLLKNEFGERDILGMVNRYFELVKEIKVLDQSEASRKYLNNIKDLYLEGLLGLRLIEEEPKVSVFVEIDDTATQALNEFRQLLDMMRQRVDAGDRYLLRAKLRIAKARLEEFIVETYEENAAPTESVYDGVDIKYLGRVEVRDYYDSETGLRLRGRVQASFW